MIFSSFCKLPLQFICRTHHLHRALAFIIFIAPSRSSFSLRRCTHYLHCTAALIIFITPSRSSSSLRRCAQLHLCAVALIVIVAPLRSSHHCTFDFLPSCSSLMSRPSRAHLHLLFCAVAPSSSSSRLLRTHLHGAHRVPIFIVAPIARPSSSLHPSRAHLHVAPVARPSSTSCPLPAYLLHLHTAAPFFILIAALSRLSSSAHCPAHLHLYCCTVALIFELALSCSSSWLRCCTHYIIAPSSTASSLRHQAHKLHRCAITCFASQFIVAPSRLRAHIFFVCSLAAHLCMPAFFPLSAITVLKYSFNWSCSSLPCRHLFFFFPSSFIFALSHADLYCCVVAH